MDFKGHISESAFLVNESRARRVELSKDKYASLWVGDSTRRLWEAFSDEVYPHDAIELGLRNRYFLERLSSFAGRHSAPAFVNIGAGFTSYPLLLAGRIECTEVDYLHVIEYKRSHLAKWSREGITPRREIKFIDCDLTEGSERKRLSAALEKDICGRPSFVLMEGLTYYLPRALLMELIGMIGAVQTPGSVLAFDFWRPENAAHPVFLRFEKFFAERFGVAENEYNFIDGEFVSSIEGYDTVELKSIQELELIFSDTRILQDPAEILPESYAVLVRAA